MDGWMDWLEVDSEMDGWMNGWMNGSCEKQSVKIHKAAKKGDK